MVPNQIQILVWCDINLSQQQIQGFHVLFTNLKTHDIALHVTSKNSAYSGSQTGMTDRLFAALHTAK